MRTEYKASAYNHAVSYRNNRVLLFNGVTGALVAVDQHVFRRLEPILFGSHNLHRQQLETSDFGPLLTKLIQAHYLIEEDLDELSFLRERFRYYQEHDPVSVTVATTMDCNLGCYYCYEEKYPAYVSRSTCDQIYDFAIADLEQRKQKKLAVTWYGGEPMLNTDAIEYLSTKFLSYCDPRGIRYVASMVTNGTQWPDRPEDIAAFAERIRLRHVQFSFDGLPENHNKRRKPKDRESLGSSSSFERLCQTVDALRGHLKIYLRLNLDHGNQHDAFKLVDFFHQQGWLFKGSKVYPYLAHLGPVSPACGFMESASVTIEISEFDRLNNQFRRYLSKYMDIREYLQLHQYPTALKLNCVAVTKHGVLFGPDGSMYKCANEIGIHARSYDRLRGSELFPILSRLPKPDSPHDYMTYDPFSHPSCSKCKYLPNCLGGCPMQQFEKSQYAIDAIHQFWENQFEPMIRAYADAMFVDGGFVDDDVTTTPLGRVAVEERQETAGFSIN